MSPAGGHLPPVSVPAGRFCSIVLFSSLGSGAAADVSLSVSPAGREAVFGPHPAEDREAGRSAEGQQVFLVSPELRRRCRSLLLTSASLCSQDDVLSIRDMSSLKAPLEIPIPDPPTPEDEVRSSTSHLTAGLL